MPQIPGDFSSEAVAGDATLGSSLEDSAPRRTLSSEPLRLIAFNLDSEWYALEIHHVTGIEPEMEITPVPKAPEWLVGVFNLHGAILPAIDPRSLLGVSTRGRKASGLLIVFQWDGNQAALLVDSVDEMYELPRTSVEPQLATVEGLAAQLTQGHVRVRDRLIGVIDLHALLKALLKE